ncbi:HAD family hydrolase [Roseivirga echinicomitans]|nr:HAD hydrolase-like protein [Roseivirga echinicomitans]
MIIKPISYTELRNYKCMFFDFDGVVLESGNIKTDAFVELYSGSGIEEQVREHHLAHQGVVRYEKFKWISENLLKQEHTEEMGLELGNRFSELVKGKVLAAPFVPGFREMITFIRQQNIYCVVASGTPQEELREIIINRKLSPFFDEVYGSPREKAEITLEVMQRKQFRKEDCLFFGDASTDHQAAEQTNVDFFARLTPELSDYWENAPYKYGALDFSKMQ